MTRNRRLARGASWGVADQVLSSLINFALGVSVARVGTPAEFGIYGLVFSAYLIAINVSRPVAVEPLIIRFTGKDRDEWHRAVGTATGVVVLVGLALGAASGLAGLVIAAVVDQTAGLAFFLLGIGLAGLVLQDAWRLIFFAERRGRAAFFNDLLWGATTLVVGAVLLLSDQASMLGLLGAWIVGAVAAALFGIWQAAQPPIVGPARAWWRAHRDLGRPLLAEHLLSNGLNEVVPYVVGAIAGLAAVAALRAAKLLLGPFNVVFQAMGLVALPEGVRIAERSPARLLPIAFIFSAGLVAAVSVVGLIVANLPDEIGTAILGQTWFVAEDVMLPYTLLMAGLMASAGPMVALRAMGAAFETMVTGGARSILGLIGAILGAWSGGAPGAALGMAIGTWVGSAGAWWRFLRLLRQPAEERRLT